MSEMKTLKSLDFNQDFEHGGKRWSQWMRPKLKKHIKLVVCHEIGDTGESLKTFTAYTKVTPLNTN